MRLADNPNLPAVEPVVCAHHRPEWTADTTNWWCLQYRGTYYPFGHRETALKALKWWDEALRSGRLYESCESCADGAQVHSIAPRRALRRPNLGDVRVGSVEEKRAQA